MLESMPRRLAVIQDDLFFAARVEQHARRLGVITERIRPDQVDGLAPDHDRVVVLQLTLHPDKQLGLLERLLARLPEQRVVAVTGHLETALRRRARALGVSLASHSAMDRTLARACEVVGPAASEQRPEV